MPPNNNYQQEPSVVYSEYATHPPSPPRSVVSSSYTKAVNADPPTEAVWLVLVIVIGCSISLFYSTSDATGEGLDMSEAVTMPLFHDMISKLTLGWIRVSIALGIFATTYYRIFHIKGAQLIVPYLKQSKLKKIPIKMDGIKSQTMFTCWSWNLLGLSFGLNGAITLLSCYPSQNQTIVHELFLHPTMLQMAIYLFEVVAPTSMLVSFVVRYALWPAAKKAGTSNVLKTPIGLITHNLNILTSLVEVGLLGRMPIQMKDLAVGPLYGCMYIFFTWFMIYRWIPATPTSKSYKKELNGHSDGYESYKNTRNPQFVYFFFDTTLGKWTHISVMLVLVGVLTLFFLLFSNVNSLMLYLGGTPLINFGVVITLFSVVARFRD